MNPRATWVAAAFLAVGCAGQVAGPADTSAPVTIDGIAPLRSRPYGVAIGGGDAVYVTRLDDARVARYRLATRDLVRDNIRAGEVPTGAASSPDGRMAYVASQSGEVGFHDLTTDDELATWSFEGAAFNVSASPDGRQVYVGTNRGWVYVLSTASRAVIDSVRAGGAVNWFAADTIGGRVYFSDFSDGRIRSASFGGGPSTVLATLGGGPQGIDLSRDGTRLYVARQAAGDIEVLEVATGRSLGTIPLPGGPPFGLLRRPGTDLLWVTTLSGHLLVVDPIRETILEDLPLGGTLRRFAFDRDGKRAVIADENGRVIFVH